MPSVEGECIASIDLGSHTARLLVAERVEGPGLFRPLARERAYIRLADGQNPGGAMVISPRALARTLKTLKTFAAIADRIRGQEHPYGCHGNHARGDQP